MENYGFVGSGGESVHVAVHRPVGGGAVGGVLVFAPFGVERKGAHRMFVRFARRAAAAGWLAIRFDGRGCGESTGAHAEMTLKDWVADAQAVWDAVCCPSGIRKWTFVGARLGANLALEFAESARPARIGLVEPLLSGDGFLRDLRRRQRIQATILGGAGPESQAADANRQGEDFGGYVAGPELAEDLSDLNLLEQLGRLPAPVDAGLWRVGPSERVPPPWREVFEWGEGAENRVVENIRDKPFWGQLDYYESDEVLGPLLQWLQAGADDPVTVSDLSLRGEAVLEEGGTERAVEFGAPGRRLRGCLVQAAQPSGTGVVAVHGWSGTRSGPNRILVHLTRALARGGACCLRFDLGGRGDSEGSGIEANLSTMADDLVEAVRFLRDKTEVERLLLLGICSGGNVVVGALPRLGPVRGLLLLSVYPFSDGDSFGRDVNRTLHFLGVYWRKLRQAETWRRFTRGEVSLRAVAGVLFGHYTKRRQSQRGNGAITPAASPGGTASGVTSAAAANEGRFATAPPRTHLRKLLCRVPALMVYGTRDPDAGAAEQYFADFAGEHDLPVSVTHVEGAGHNFGSAMWMGQVAAALGDFVKGLAQSTTDAKEF